MAAGRLCKFSSVLTRLSNVTASHPRRGEYTNLYLKTIFAFTTKRVRDREFIKHQS